MSSPSAALAPSAMVPTRDIQPPRALSALYRVLALAALLCPVLASAQATWPNFMPSLEAGLSNSPVPAVLPIDAAITPPDPGLAPDKARWSGAWSGWACANQVCDARLIVEKVTEQGATLVYAGASAQTSTSQRVEAKFKGGELEAVLPDGGVLALRMRKSAEIEFLLTAASGRNNWIAGVLSRGATTFVRQVERIPTPFTEGGKPVTLEVVVFKPTGSGPFPAVMFNHGSTGMGNQPALFTQTWTSPALARYFTDKGWLVAFPQRRGRGKSGGLYDEGFERDRSRYSCAAELSLPGVDRALADMGAALDYLVARPDVDRRRLLVGGQSRGGVLSVAFAGAQPSAFLGVVNFVGGWMGDGCSSVDAINPVVFKRGAAYPTPMLWLYGENDPFYKMAHSRSNFDAFLAAGGKGSFHAYPAMPGRNGHGLIAAPEQWRDAVDAYLGQVERK